MAENVTYQSATPATPPDSTVVAADDVGGVKYQQVKLVDGAADGTAGIPGDAANGLDVDVTRSALPTGAATEVSVGAISAVEGAVADAAVVTDANGTVSGKLRGLVKWAFERMPASLGQKTKANSFPVVIASDQDALAVSLSSTTVTGSVAVTGPLTDVQLRASAVPVSATQLPAALGAGTAAQSMKVVLPSDQAAIPITDNSGSLTVDAPVAAPAFVRLSDGAAAITTLPVSGPLTDTQLRATPVPISGTVTASGPLTDTQLRASAVPISDGAGSLTVDAPVGTPAFVRLSDGAAAITALPVTDNAGSLTVDAPVGTPVFTRLSDGSATLIGQKAMAASLPVVIASDQTVIPVNGDIDHDVVNTLKNVQMAGNAQPTDVPPTAVSANGDRVRAWFDRYGSPVVRSRRIRESYTAVFRLAETAARLDPTFTQVANTNKQWFTLHHASAATKEVRLQKCIVYLTSDTTAGIQGVLELRQINTAPATGNPAITPTAHRRGATAAEAIALCLPTTQGTEVAVNSPLAHVPFDTGISGAVSTVNPVPILTPITLYDASQEDPEVMQPTLPVATLDGWGVMMRTVGVPVLRMTCVMTFTEEIP